MKKKAKEILTIVTITLVVLGIILGINTLRANNDSQYDSKTMECIANNSKLIVSKTCSYCAYQKEILKNYLNMFELIYIDEHPEIFALYEIRGIPTWIINEKLYSGFKTIEQLKEITNC